MTYDDWKADIRNEHGSAPDGPEEDRMLIGAQHWWQDHGEIARLLRYLDKDDEAGPLEMADAIAIVEKPWHWDAEYQQMCREQTEPGMGNPEWAEDVIG